MAYTMPVMTQVEVEVAYVDRAGNPATIDGTVTWDSSNPTVATVTPGSGNTATIQTAGQIATAQVTASADADLGEGVRSLVTLLDVSVVAGEAVAGTISPVGEATPLP